MGNQNLLKLGEGGEASLPAVAYPGGAQAPCGKTYIHQFAVAIAP